jgi:hypothetical protein
VDCIEGYRGGTNSDPTPSDAGIQSELQAEDACENVVGGSDAESQCEDAAEKCSDVYEDNPTELSACLGEVAKGNLNASAGS